jgi:3-oxoacyl-[acyl-carrier-protein] synthase-3
MRVFLRGLACSLGEHEHEVRDMSEMHDKPAIMRELLDQGCARYRTTERSPAVLARESLERTLDACALAPTEVDAVVYCSFSVWDLEFCSRHVSSAMCGLGLDTTPLVGLHLGACGLLGNGLRVASDMIRGSDARRVLVVTTDRVPPDRSRVVDEFSVLSDGAASCLVTDREDDADFELVSLVPASRFRVDALPEHAQRWVLYLNGVRTTFVRTLERAGRGLGELDLLVHNNYIEKQRRCFAELAGVGLDRTFGELVGSIGYVHAADVLINLAEARTRGRLRAGDFALALSTGRSAWTCFGVLAR